MRVSSVFNPWLKILELGEPIVVESNPTVSIFLRSPGDEETVLISTRSEELPTGETGKYQIVGQIAQGGIGVVLKGHDVQLGRDVAMKFLRRKHADSPQ